MLIRLELEDKVDHYLIGSKPPTRVLWCKVDGILSVMEHKSARFPGAECSELTILGLPGAVVALEAMDKLAERVNQTYQSLGATGSFIRQRADSGPDNVIKFTKDKGGPALVE